MRDGGDAAKTDDEATQLQDRRMPKQTVDPQRDDDAVEQRLHKQRDDRIDEKFRHERAKNVDFPGHGAHSAGDTGTAAAKSGAFGSKPHRMPTRAWRQVKSFGPPRRQSAKAVIASSMDERIVAQPSSTCMGLCALK
jgi:hypothetical protein